MPRLSQYKIKSSPTNPSFAWSESPVGPVNAAHCLVTFMLGYENTGLSSEVV